MIGCMPERKPSEAQSCRRLQNRGIPFDARIPGAGQFEPTERHMDCQKSINLDRMNVDVSTNQVKQCVAPF